MKQNRFSLIIHPHRSAFNRTKVVNGTLEKLLRMANKVAKSRRSMYIHILKSRGYEKAETVFFAKINFGQ